MAKGIRGRRGTRRGSQRKVRNKGGMNKRERKYVNARLCERTAMGSCWKSLFA